MRRTAATFAIAASLVVGCTAPAPTSLGPPPAPALSADASAAVASTPTVAPTTNVETEPSSMPEQDLEPVGIEAFSKLESGEWELAMSADNIDQTAQQSNFRPMTAFAEILVRCAGRGRLTVRMTAGPPQNSPDALATFAELGTTEVDCPRTDGITISLAGTAPDGWYASPDIDRSDPSITYQVLVGTIVD